jgi:UDP-glucuronate decarboxylase
MPKRLKVLVTGEVGVFRYIQDMRLLVAGGGGFLGSHLCDRLLKDGHEVIALDNFYTGQTSNIKHLRENSNFELIRQDVTEQINLEVDGIFNLACPASPVHYQKNPVQTLRTNVHGAMNLLELANRLGVRIFQASTSEVYGDPEVDPQNEEYWGRVNPIGIRSCYDEGKRAAETLFMDYHRQYGLDIRIARIFNTFGPRMARNDGRVVTNFIHQALANEDLTVYGDGSQTRSFCYVSDLIEGFHKLFFSDGLHFPVNLGNPTPVTMLDLANEIIELTKSRSKVRLEPLPLDDPKDRCPDIAKAIKLLDWKPEISRQEGLKRTIASL